MKKRGQFGILIVLALVVILLSSYILYYFYFNTGFDSLTGASVGIVGGDCKIVEMPYEYEEEYYESYPYTEEKCQEEEFVHAVEDFHIDYQKCLSFNEKGICVEKKISCSLAIYNFDEEKGRWTLDFQFFDENGNLVKTNLRTKIIYPENREEFQASASFIGEEADEEYTCDYLVKEIPSREVCRDIEMPGEVRRKRIIILNRTEEICE